MERHTVRFEAKHTGYIIRAFGALKGDKPILLSYKIGEILRPIREQQNLLQERLQPFLRATGVLRSEMSDEENEALMEVLDTEIELADIPTITVDELLSSNLKIEEDGVIQFLVDVGVVAP
jgi:transcriptional regulator with XRE-family HTH domain